MKRLLAFLILLSLGFLALHLLLDDEAQRKTDPATDSKPTPLSTPRQGDGIRVQDGTELQIGGGFTIPRARSVPKAGGGVTFVPVYELSCTDCKPTTDGRYRLTGVRMQLFDRGEHVADLTATQAMVELKVDEQHRRSLREDKEIELSDAKLITVPGARMGPLRLEVASVRILVDELAVAMRTPDDNTPVLLVLDGDRKGELRGRGMRARMPKDESAAFGRLDVLLLRDARLSLANVDLDAKGQLHYVEQLATGAGLITVEDDVHVVFIGGDGLQPDASGTAASRQIEVRGSRLHGWMQRTRRGDDGIVGHASTVRWTLLRLLGTRAKVTTGDTTLESPRLTVQPGPTGELASITADGGPSDLTQTGKDGKGATFRSPRPIHLVRLDAWCGAVHRSFGFPPFALGPLQDLEVVTFDGASEVDAGDGVEVAADRGLHLFRRKSSATNGDLVARGFGVVRITRRDQGEAVEARGDNGFLFWRTPAGDEVVLGRNDPSAEQTFTLQRGSLRVDGRGACSLVRNADATVRIDLASTLPTIGMDMLAGAEKAHTDSPLGRVRNATRVHAVVAGEMVREFEVEGPATTFEFDRDGRRVVATGRRLQQTAPTTWQLDGTDDEPARIDVPVDPVGNGGTVRAPRIDLHQLSSTALLVDARGSSTTKARIDATIAAAPGRDPRSVHAAADRVRLSPFAIGPSGILRHHLGLTSALTNIVAGGLARPWLLAGGAVAADLTGGDQGEVHGDGELLIASEGRGALLFAGNAEQQRPASLRRSDGGEPSLFADGARIRVASIADGQRIDVLTTFADRNTMVPPRVRFRGAPAAGDRSAVGWMRGECGGEIEVLPEVVLFHGPVTATSLKQDGSDDPDGMHITAQQLQMNRLRETGELVRVQASGGVAVDWRAMHARSRNLELDLKWKRCIADDPDGATIRFDDGHTYRAPRIEANYGTWSVSTWHGRLVREAEASARR